MLTKRTKSTLIDSVVVYRFKYCTKKITKNCLNFKGPVASFSELITYLKDMQFKCTGVTPLQVMKMKITFLQLYYAKCMSVYYLFNLYNITGPDVRHRFNSLCFLYKLFVQYLQKKRKHKKRKRKTWTLIIVLLT